MAEPFGPLFGAMVAYRYTLCLGLAYPPVSHRSDVEEASAECVPLLLPAFASPELQNGTSNA